MTTDAPEISRVTRTRLVAQKAGGKGLNVVRVLGQLGVRNTVAVAPLGGHEGVQFESLADEDGVPLHTVPVDAATRICVACQTSSGKVFEFNETGGGLTGAEWQTLADRIVALAGGTDTVVFSGSFPRGTKTRHFTDLIARLQDVGSVVVVDTSGPMLLSAVESGVDLVVPNLNEARSVMGMPQGTATQLAKSLSGNGVSALVTDGAEGAVLAYSDGALHVATPPKVTVASTVGAGDALLAGWLAGQNRHLLPAEALRLATAVGAAACTATTAGVVDPQLVERLLEDAPPVRTIPNDT